jgi:radical SAM-linked protein
MPVAYSRGFHPQPRLSFSPALPVGTESDAEFVEAELTLPVPSDRLSAAVSPHLPAGIRLLDARLVPPLGPFISDFDLVCGYRVVPDPGAALPDALDAASVAAARAAFLAAETVPLASEKDGKRSEVDLRKLVADFGMNGDALSITIVHGTGKGVRPLDALSALLGIELPPSRYSTRKVSAEPRPRMKA